MDTSLRVRSIAGEELCCLPRGEVAEITVAELEDRIRGVLGLSVEEDILFMADGRTLDDKEVLGSLCFSSVPPLEVQCVAQAPFCFRVQRSPALTEDDLVLVRMSRRAARKLKVASLKARCCTLGGGMNLVAASCDLTLGGLRLKDESTFSEVLAFDDIAEVDLLLETKQQMLIYFSVAIPATTQTHVPTHNPVESPISENEAERMAAQTASPVQLQALMQRRFAKSLALRQK